MQAVRAWQCMAWALLLSSSCPSQTLSFKRTDYPAGKTPSAIAVGDFNKDGIPDIVAADFFGSSIDVLLGNKDGSLQKATILSTAVSPLAVVVADFNKDGNLDVGLATGGPYSQEKGFNGVGGIYVFVGKGDGTFSAGTEVFAASGANNLNGGIGCLGTADLNHDGKPDLVDCNGDVLLGNGDGTFTAGHVQCFGQSVAIADLNGDQKLDLIYGSNSSGSVCLGSGDGTFGTPKNISSPMGAAGAFWAVSVGDVNGDGKPDLIVGESGVYFGSPPKTGDLLVYFGNGDGTFQQPAVYGASRTNPVSTILVDVNGDSKLDVVSFNIPGDMYIYLNKGDGTFAAPLTFSTDPPFQDLNSSPVMLAAADFLGNGKADFALAGSTGVVSVLLNNTILPAVGAVANGASFLDQAVAPGSLITIFGTDLAAATVPAASIPLPTTLGDTSVTNNGIAAPLLLVSQFQINAQVPWNVLPSGTTSANVPVVVTRAGNSASGAFQMPVAEFGPAIFTFQNGIGQAAAINPDGSVAGTANPAAPGSTIVVYATGLGAVTPVIDSGAAPGNDLRNAATQPTVLIGGVAAQVAFAGLSPQFVGVNQINVVVPAVPTPGAVPLQIQVGDLTSSDKATIAVAKQ